ncbi:MAG: hypothetical protein JXL80_06675 [Planctomycetes bacterium]|nr:hypothetical protein [Planctomycetota bacterium]
MFRTTLAWSVVALVAVSAGCRMCASPYDDCRPTYTGDCGHGCLPNAREGSILSHGMQPVSGAEMVLPVPADVIYETGEVISAPGETISARDETMESVTMTEPQVETPRPVRPLYRSASSRHSVRRQPTR